MKKNVSSREFLHGFASIHAQMKAGDSITITNHGKPIGEFTKHRPRKKLPLPNLKELGLEPKASLEVREEVYQRVMKSITGEAIY